MWDVIAAELAKGGPLAGWLLAAVLLGAVGYLWRANRADAKAAREALRLSEELRAQSLASAATAAARDLKASTDAHLEDLRNLVTSFKVSLEGLAKVLSTRRMETQGHDGGAI